MTSLWLKIPKNPLKYIYSYILKDDTFGKNYISQSCKVWAVSVCFFIFFIKILENNLQMK